MIMSLTVKLYYSDKLIMPNHPFCFSNCYSSSAHVRQSNHNASTQGSGVPNHSHAQTPTHNYVSMIDNLVMGTNTSRNSPSEIIRRVNALRDCTFEPRPVEDPGLLRTAPHGHNINADHVFVVYGIYDRSTDAYKVEYALRKNFPEFYASDAYLAQLSKVMPIENNNFPVQLPRTIIRDSINNRDTMNTIDQIYAYYGFSHDREINFRLDRSNPGAISNQQLYAILMTANAKSVINLLNDMKRVTGVNNGIDSVTLHKRPHHIVFQLTRSSI